MEKEAASKKSRNVSVITIKPTRFSPRNAKRAAQSVPRSLSPVDSTKKKKKADDRDEEEPPAASKTKEVSAAAGVLSTPILPRVLVTRVDSEPDGKAFEPLSGAGVSDLQADQPTTSSVAEKRRLEAIAGSDQEAADQSEAYDEPACTSKPVLQASKEANKASSAGPQEHGYLATIEVEYELGNMVASLKTDVIMDNK